MSLLIQVYSLAELLRDGRLAGGGRELEPHLRHADGILVAAGRLIGRAEVRESNRAFRKERGDALKELCGALVLPALETKVAI